MIRSFRDKKTERLFAGESVREFSGIRNVAERKLVMLDSATDLKDLLASRQSIGEIEGKSHGTAQHQNQRPMAHLFQMDG